MHRLVLSAIAFILAATLIARVDAIEKPTGIFSSSGATANDLYGNPNLRGVLISARWSDIEASPGNYDFTAIDAQVSVAEANGKSWSLAIPGGGTGSPDWLTDDPAQGGLGAAFINYSFRGVPGYRLPLYWSPVVQNRIALLVNAVAAQYEHHANLKLVYVMKMTANGNEGHLQGIDMNTLIAAGNDRDGDGDVDGEDFQINWIEASKQAARSYAQAFSNKAIVFEVHEVNGSAVIPEAIINDLWNDPELEQRVGAAMWWISGKTSYQSELISVLTEFPGDIYGQIIGKSGEPAWQSNTGYSKGFFRMPTNPPPTNLLRYEVTTAGTSGSTEPNWPTINGVTVTDGSVTWTCRGSRFENGDYATVFSQAKSIGLRYLEPWEWEFKTSGLSANGGWDAVLADFNAWADAVYRAEPPDISRTLGGDHQLSWPTTPGVTYQVEWSPDLSQWSPVGSPTTGTGESMSWIDDGSEIPSPPNPKTPRYYRLRLY